MKRASTVRPPNGQEHEYGLNRVVASDSELSRVITIHINCFDVFAGKRLPKPASLDPTQVFENSKSGHASRCPYPLRVIKSQAIHFSFDDGSVPVKKTFEGLARTSSHAQGVLHGGS